MSRVSGVRDLEDCYDGSRVRELLFEAPVDVACMEAMAIGADLRYAPGLEHPVYRIRRAGLWTLLGVIGSPVVRATLPSSAPGDALATLLSEIEAIDGD